MKQLTIKLKAVFFCLALLGTWSLAQAAPPQKVNFQGRLTDLSDNPLNGTYSLIFSLYSAPTGGTQMWTETQSGVSIVNGALDTELGSVTPVPYSAASAAAYLEIQVDGETLSPRQSFNSVLYSYNTYQLGGLTAAEFVNTSSSQAITGVKMFSANPVFNPNAIAQRSVYGLEAALAGVAADTTTLKSQIDEIPGDNMGDHTATQALIMGFYPIVSSGTIMAANFVGDGSGLTGVTGTGDNLGDHTATTVLQMGAYGVNSSSNITAGRYQIAGSTVLAILPGTGSLGVGVNAGRFNTGIDNVFVGRDAGYTNTTGGYNSFVGYTAGRSNTTGGYNTFVGYQAGFNNTSAIYNAIFGATAGSATTTGGSNTFVGYGAGNGNTTGGYNSFMGTSAGGNNTTGSNNAIFGHNAGYNTMTGSANAIFGDTAGYGSISTSFSSSTLIGYQAGRSLNNGGDKNIFIGYMAASAATTGTGNIVIGNNESLSVNTASNELNIGGAIYGNLSTGNVGIGVVNPGTKLAVSGGIVATSSITAQGGFYGDGSGLTGVTGTGDNLGNHTATQELNMAGYGIAAISSMSVAGNFFSVGGSTLVVKNGYVGIGKNPSYFFDVAGRAVFTDQVDIWTMSGPALLQAPSGTLQVNAAAGGDIALQGNGVQRAVFKNTGNVGIGTASPAYRLVVSSGAGETGTIFAVAAGTANVVRMTGLGDVYATKFYGDGSALTGISAPGDNLGNHMATLPLNMAGYPIVNISSLTLGGLAVTGGAFAVMNGTAPALNLQNASLGLGTMSPGLGATAAYGNILHIYDNNQYQYPGIFIEDNDSPGARWFVHTHGDGRNSFAIRDDVNAFEPLYIEGADIGIGTDDYTPMARLHVLSSAPVQNIFLASNGPYFSTIPRFVVKGNGNVGIGTESPAYQFVIDGTTGYAGAMVEISTGGAGVITMYGNGDIYAGKYYGDGSGLTNVTGTGDNLGDHTATQALGMGGFAITGVSTITMLNGSIAIVPPGTGGSNGEYGISIGSGSYNNYSAGVGLGFEARNNYSYGTGLGMGAYDNYNSGTGVGHSAASNYDNGVGVGSAANYNYNYGVGVGNQAYNNYDYGVGVGAQANTNSNYGVGVGYGAGNNASYGVGIGHYAAANDNNGVGIGSNAAGNRDFAVGIGAYSSNNGVYSAAVGAYSYANSSATALGSYARATAPKSVAIGNGTVNNSTGTASFGSYGIYTSSIVTAANFVGNGSGLTGISGDNLGNHTAITDLNMSSYTIFNVQSMNAGTYYGDGSNLTGITVAGDNLGDHTAAQNLDMASYSIVNIASMTVTGDSFSIGGSSLVVMNGRVGIGAAFPTSDLQIVNAAAAAELNISGQINPNVANARLVFNNASIEVGTGETSDQSYMALFTKPSGSGITERVRISSLGAVGIGIQDPQAALDVKSTATASIAQYWRDETGTPVAQVASDGSVYSAGGFYGSGAGLSDLSGEFDTSFVNVGSTAGYAMNGVTILRSSASLYGIFVGEFAGAVNAGLGNVFVGYEAGLSNTSGEANTFMGLDAGYSNTSGSQNAFLGSDAGYNNNLGAYNSFFGADAGYTNTIGTGNTFIGSNAGFENISGSSNTLLGYGAGGLVTIGGGNTLLGTLAGANLTTGGQNIIIGNNAQATAPTISNELNIGGLIWGRLQEGTVGIGFATTLPQAALDVRSTFTATNAQIWRDETGMAVATMTSSGHLMAKKGMATGIQEVNLSGSMTSFAADGSGLVYLNQVSDSNTITSVTGCDSGAVAQGQQVLFVAKSYSAGIVTMPYTLSASVFPDSIVSGSSAFQFDAATCKSGSNVAMLCTTINATKAWTVLYLSCAY